ncbi:isoflavone 2'-hydroxylase [Phtheirospermum japonicum]|uniref:(+)-piperitol/(+)-sesamin synthase n=1 Tax=Phtheirospermum japonicum TaxID=374723 RepID=A0A830B6P8_9LAMI|nr:isoflavone 2'-hydroxylase [Phtheirospermum japonicum]
MEILYLFSFLSLLAFFHILVPFYLRKLQKLPPSPPFSLPLIGHLYLFKPPLHRTLAKISNKYGPILLLRFGSRPVLIVSSPSAAEECFTKNDVVFANRPRLLAGKHIGYNYTNLVWAPYGDHWRNLRRIASVEVLSTHRIQTTFAATRRNEVHLLVERLLRGGTSEDEYRVNEMKTAFFEMMLNIMMRMIAGKRYYDDSGNLKEAGEFKEIVEETFQVSGATNIGDFLPMLRWFGINNLEKRLQVVHAKRNSFMQDLIDEHKILIKGCEGERAKTLIDVLLSLQQTDPECYTDEYVKGMILVMLSAGTDTSVATMEWAMSLLLNNPDTLIKAQTEIDSVVGHSRLVDDSDLSHLPYLHGIINETLRMCPAAPLLVPHEASADCTVGGYRVPRGTMLLVNVWAIQNDPNLWDDPRTFKPERFLNLQGQRDGCVLMPFGYGRRGCPGENFAMRVVGLTLASLVQCFEWERVDGEMVDMSEGPGLTMPKARPLVAKCRPRPAMGRLISQI